MYYRTINDFRIGDTEDWVVETLDETSLARLYIAGVKIADLDDISVTEGISQQRKLLAATYYAGGDVKKWLSTHEFFDDSIFYYNIFKAPSYDMVLEYDWDIYHFIETCHSLIRLRTDGKRMIRVIPILGFSHVNTSGGHPRVFSGKELRRYAVMELNDMKPDVSDDEYFIVFHEGNQSLYLNVQTYKYYYNYARGSAEASSKEIGYRK